MVNREGDALVATGKHRRAVDQYPRNNHPFATEPPSAAAIVDGTMTDDQTSELMKADEDA
jgi:hypothetical protein